MTRPTLKLNFKPGCRQAGFAEALQLGLVEIIQPNEEKMARAQRFARRKGRK